MCSLLIGVLSICNFVYSVICWWFEVNEGWMPWQKTTPAVNGGGGRVVVPKGSSLGFWGKVLRSVVIEIWGGAVYTRKNL